MPSDRVKEWVGVVGAVLGILVAAGALIAQIAGLAEWLPPGPWVGSLPTQMLLFGLMVVLFVLSYLVSLRSLYLKVTPVLEPNRTFMLAVRNRGNTRRFFATLELLLLEKDSVVVPCTQRPHNLTWVKPLALEIELKHGASAALPLAYVAHGENDFVTLMFRADDPQAWPIAYASYQRGKEGGVRAYLRVTISAATPALPIIRPASSATGIYCISAFRDGSASIWRPNARELWSASKRRQRLLAAPPSSTAAG